MTRNFYRAAAASRRRSLAGFRKEKGTNEMIEALGTKTRKLFVAKNSFDCKSRLTNTNNREVV